MQKNWWKINSETLIDTPFLAVYEDRVRQNIERLISYVKGDTQRLRPHIKTHVRQLPKLNWLPIKM
jgi:D-serine deaminase-like pyridoxal phosphate-dependent protein